MKEFDTLMKFEELYKALSCSILGRNVPAVLKYSIGERILSELADVGSKIYLADKLRLDGKTYKARQWTTTAQEDFIKVEYKIRLFVQDPRINVNREFIFKTETEFKRMLGGWANALSSSERR